MSFLSYTVLNHLTKSIYLPCNPLLNESVGSLSCHQLPCNLNAELSQIVAEKRKFKVEKEVLILKKRKLELELEKIIV